MQLPADSTSTERVPLGYAGQARADDDKKVWGVVMVLLEGTDDHSVPSTQIVVLVPTFVTSMVL